MNYLLVLLITNKTSMDILGIDIGGSGMKGALVNIETGELITERFRIPTPASRKPKEMAKVFKDIVALFDYKGFPNNYESWCV